MAASLRRSASALFARAASALVACATLLAPAAVRAEFPERPVKLVVGFGPGTGSDIHGRVVAEALARELKVPVVVENRPGAAGTLAAASVSSAQPDGYTLLFGTTTMIVTLPMMSTAAKYDGVRDFTPVGSMGKAPFVVVVPNKPGTPATLRDLLAAMKAAPSPSYGSLGNGSFGHLATLRILQQAGGQALHIPYKSSAQELQDLAAGQLAFVIDSVPATQALVRGGLLRPLAVTTRTRVASLPDVPTVAEVLGIDFEHAVWTGLMAPKGTPAPIVQRLSAALKAAQESKELQDRFASMELVPFAIDASALAQYIRAEVPAWQAFFSKTGIRIDE